MNTRPLRPVNRYIVEVIETRRYEVELIGHSADEVCDSVRQSALPAGVLRRSIKARKIVS